MRNFVNILQKGLLFFGLFLSLNMYAQKPMGEDSAKHPQNFRQFDNTPGKIRTDNGSSQLKNEPNTLNFLMSSNYQTISKMKKDSKELADEKRRKEAEFTHIKDSIELDKRKLESQNIRLENEKLIAASLLKENENKRNIFLFSLGIFLLLILILGLFFYVRFRYKQKTYDKLNAAYTEIRQTNKELIETTEKLKESEQFKQRFLANMSHEIRTPMNAVYGMTNLLLKTDITEQQAKYLTSIKKSGENLIVIVNDILDLSKIEAGKMELEKLDIDLHATIENIWNILKFKAEEKGLDLRYNINPDVPKFVKGDETRLNQILINLTGNAIKFTETGKVEINIELHKEENENKLVRFSVKDSGIGIPEDKLAKIFESFSQATSETARKFGGTGLGLTISKHLVELHGGTLEVKSESGKGSEFYFIIPYQEGMEISLINEKDTVSLNLNRPLKILLAEDNEFNQIVAVDTLDELFPGIQIEVVENGKIALDKLRETDFDLVLMDIQMPEMDGMTATRTIRETFPEPRNKMKICAMTAGVTKQEIDELFESGLNDYITKPFEPADLKKKIIELVNAG